MDPSIILFAIQSAIKLGRQSRKAYVDSTRSRALVLPLPDFNSTPSFAIAFSYYKDKVMPEKTPTRLKDLTEKIKNNQNFTTEEKADLKTFYIEDKLLDQRSRGHEKPAADGSVISNEALNALVTIRQWERGTDPNPSVMQRVAGTLVEIGVDYFVNVPGSLNKNSKEGKALYAFLKGLDDVQFSEASMGDLAQRLFLATLETVSENSDLVSEDPKIQELITTTTTALGKDVSAYLEQIVQDGGNLDKRERVLQWAEVVFRSVLGSGGKLVAENPGRFLGVSGEGKTTLVSDVSQAVLTMVLDQPQGELDHVFSKKSIDAITKAALGAVSKHPELVLGNTSRLKPLLSQIIDQSIQADSIIDKKMVPELIRIILEKTAVNLPVIWPDTQDPKKNLLLIVTGKTLEILSAEPSQGESWKLRFNEQDLTSTVEAVLDEVANNPGWAVNAAADLDKNFGIAMEAMLKVLRTRTDNRLSTETGSKMLQAGIRAVALRAEFVEELPNGQPLVAAAMDAIIGTIFEQGQDQKAAWRLVKNETLVSLVDKGFDELGKTGISPENIKVLKTIVMDQVETINSGQSWDLDTFGKEIETAISNV